TGRRRLRAFQRANTTAPSTNAAFPSPLASGGETRSAWCRVSVRRHRVWNWFGARGAQPTACLHIPKRRTLPDGSTFPSLRYFANEHRTDPFLATLLAAR